jgi:hypothetical protein
MASVTKYDLKELKNTLKRDIKEIELTHALNLAETKADLIPWVVSVGLLQTTLIAAQLLKILTALPA